MLFFESKVNEKKDGDHCGVAIVHFQVQGKLGWEPKGVLGRPNNRHTTVLMTGPSQSSNSLFSTPQKTPANLNNISISF